MTSESITMENVNKFREAEIPHLLRTLSIYYGYKNVALFGGAVRDLKNNRPLSDFDILIWPDHQIPSWRNERRKHFQRDVMRRLGYTYYNVRSEWETYEGNFWPAWRVESHHKPDYLHVDLIEIGPWVNYPRGSYPLVDVIDWYTSVINSKYAWLPGYGFYEFPDARNAHMAKEIKIIGLTYEGPPLVENWHRMMVDYVPRLLSKYKDYDVRVVYE